MTQPKSEDFSPKDKVQILLQEYNSLRNESIQRGNNTFQLVTAGAAMLVWILSRFQEAKLSVKDVKSWAIVFTCAAVMALFSWFIRRDINKAAARLRELEKDINERAGERL